ncbi:MAG: trypsin-like peptidase domain-containing protein [Acidobacteria bacterium]|nr:trypsin-like peptidase domain-containing protein [Acidobacteriota bacterium]
MRWRPVLAATILLSGLAAIILYSESALARWKAGAGAGPGAEPPPPPGYDDGLCGEGGGSPLSAAGSSVFRLATEVAFDTGDSAPTKTHVEGSGTVFFGRFVLTVAHAVTLDSLETTVKTPRGQVTIPVDARRVSEATHLLDGKEKVPLTPLARVEEADLALFLLPEGKILPSFPYPIGDSEALRLGDYVALLERDSVAGVLFRPGAVAALRGSEAVSALARSESVFLMSLGLIAGESGAPVVALRDGSYELVGLAQGTYIGPRQLAWAIRIKEALETLSRSAASPEARQFLTLCRGEAAAGPGRTGD